MPTTIIADAGPFIALIDSGDENHEWAIQVVRPLPRPWITCSSVLAEVTHHFGNNARVLAALRQRIPTITFEEPAPAAILALMERYAPAMDYADACAVLLCKAHKGSVVVTTDHRDFATYKVPFISPKGAFHF
ncbi:MAG: type II toxin-antitoxin system VapC family toxin [Opitutaceae bacterium]|nr:type II toxin-antitoxin system VapC family toxin [Opitutaceae bacterium]